MSVLSLSSLRSAAAKAIVAGLAAFASSDFFQHAFTLRGFEIAIAAAGLTALHAFVSTAGGVSALKAAAKAAAK